MARRRRRQRKKAERKKVLQQPGQPALEALEPRVLLSTFTVAPEADSLEEAMSAADPATGAIEFTLNADPAAAVDEVAVESRSELVFVDTGVEDYQRLVDDLRAASPDGRTVEVFLLDTERDGVEQISEILSDHQGVDAIHVVSHGTDGAVQLGDTWLSGDTLARYETDLMGWAEALSAEADLLFYGCDLAAGASGNALVQSIAKLTGADVAASEDLTGAKALGGDWTLEVATGDVETSLAFSETLQRSWSATLETATFQQGVGGYTGTLDTEIDSANPGTTLGSSVTLEADTVNSSGGVSQGLLQFGDLFGTGPGRIPLGSTITSATLELNVTDATGASANVALHRMLTPWDESSTWNSLSGGVQFDDVEAMIAADGQVATPAATGPITVSGLESALQSWSDGAGNHGWVIDITSSNAWVVSTSEDATASLRPKLTVEYVAPNSVAVASDDSLNTTEGIPVVFDPTSNDTDADSEAVSIVEFTQPANGTVVDNGDGTLTYTPDGGFSGADTFDYLAIDAGSGLQHHWGLAGNATDSIGGADGSRIGTTTVPGNLGSGLSFDEIDDHVLLPDISYASEFTVSFDFKVDENNGSLVQYLYSHGDVNSTNSLNVFLLEGAHTTDPNMLRTVIRDGNDTLDNSALQVDIASLVGDSQWHTYTLTVGAAGAEVFIDGVLSNSASYGSDGLDPAGDVHLGARHDLDPDRFFGGSLDSVQLYSRALSSTEVSDLASRANRATAVVTVAAEPTPTVSASGSSTITAGAVYTLNLSSANLGTISGWTINWGDGTIDAVAGDPGSVDHVYTQAGMTHEITVSATDENGTFTSSRLLTASDHNSTVYLLDGSTGDIAQKLPTSPELARSTGATIGPDGNFYVASLDTDSIVRFDGSTGAFLGTFVSAGSGGLDQPMGLDFGADGNLYVASYVTHEVLRYDAATGAFIDAFVPSTAGVNGPTSVEFGPDGHLYVASWSSGMVHRFDGSTGAFIDDFADTGGAGATDVAFGPDGHLYVSSALQNRVFEFDGVNGASLDSFAVSSAYSLEFGPDGHLYVSRWGYDLIEEYDPDSNTLLGTFADAADGIDGPWGIDFTPNQQVTVLANPAPTAVNDLAAVNEGGSVIIDVAGNDSDPNNALDLSSIAVTSGPANGSLVDNGDGTLTYTHDGSETVGDSFSYTVDDVLGASSNVASVTLTVTPQNDSPSVVGLHNDELNYTEGSGTVILEQGGDVLVSDVDSADFAGGSLNVEVDSGLVATEDVFAIRNQGSGAGQIGIVGSDVTYGGVVIGSFVGGTGVTPLTVSFNSNATATAVTHLVRNITYENLDLEDPTEGARSVTVDITDGDGGTSGTQNLTVNVTAVNDQAIADLDGADGAGRDFSATFTEGTGPVGVTDADATVSDVDDSDFAGLGINLSDFLDGTSEKITIAGYTFAFGVPEVVIRTIGSTDFEIDFDGSGFTISRDISGNMPQADLQTLVRGITYENTSSDPTTGDRSFDIIPQDGGGLNGLSSTATISVVATNTAPTALDDAASVDEGASVVIDLSGNDSDPDNALDLGSIVITSGPANGTLVDNGDGTLTYTHDGSETMGDGFSYTIQDASGATSNVASVTLTVTPVNEAPTDVVFDSESTAERSLNTYGTGDQMDPAIAALPDGGFVAVWVSQGQDGDGYGIYGRRFDAASVAVGSEFLVTSEISDHETNPSVTAFADGGFAVAWQDQASGVNAWTEARVFAADGTPASGEFRLSPGLDGDHEGYQPAVVALNADEFVAVWANEVGGSTYEVVGRIYDRAGNAVSGQFSVGSLASGSGLFGAQTEVARLDDGGFAVVWRTHDGANLGTRVRVMNADGTPRSAELVLAGDDIGDVAALSSGGFVVTYDASGDLHASIFDASGVSVAGPVKVNTTSSAARYESSVARSDDGFVVAWESSAGDGSGSSVLAQRFDANGTRIDAEILVNETTTGNQVKPELVETSSGQVVAVWQSENVDADLSGIASRVVATGSASVAENAIAGARVADALGVADPDADDTHTFSLIDDAGGRFAIDSVTGEITVADGSLLDYETATSHTVTVRATDAGGLSYDEALVISLLDVDEAPSAVADAATVGEGASVTIDLAANDADPEGALDLTSIQIISGPANGTLVDNGDGTLTYTHDGSETVGDSFSYTIDDVSGAASNVASVTLTVTPQNDAPTAANDAATVDEGSSVVINLTGNDSDPDNALDLSSITITSGPANGTLVDHGDGTFTYTHDGSETVGDSFSYTIDDVSGAASNVASVTLTVTPQNDAPTATNDAATVDEGSSVVINLTGNDSDPDNALDLSSITITSGPANGTLVDHGDGTLTYTHDGSETVGDSFSYTIDDVSGATSNVASVTLTVTPQNDAPTATNDAATVDEGSSVVINLAGNDSDPDNALDLSSITITSGPANGTLVDNGDGTLTYTHDGSETVGDSFSYSIDDVSGATSNVASVTLTVTPQNDAPTATNDAATVDEGSSVVINLAGNDSDPDNALDLSSITITSGPANGTLVDNGDGTLTYTHDGSETVGDSFSYSIDDVSGATSNVASVTLTVTPQNDAPTAANDAATVDEGSSVVINLAGNDSDPDNALDLSSITITSGPTNGTLVDHGDGTFTYTHDGSETVGDSFSYSIDDVSGATSNVASVTLTVTPQNDAPTAANDAATVDEGSSVVINLTGNDSDPDNALDLSSITITSGPANGTLVDNGDGTFTYTHDGSETVGDSFSYTIDDVSGAASNVASVTLTVTPQNDAPTAANDAATVDEGSSVVINLTGNDSDPDNALDLSSITITSGPANGTLVDHGDGTFTYTHDGSETVGDSFSYTIDDVSGATSNVASVTLTVTPQNDAPTAANDAATVDEGSSVVINLTGNDSDPDNALDLSSITITSGPANGTLVDHGDGTFTYTHDGSETVGDSFSYTIDDVSGATSNVASVTLTVTPQNDAPTAANDAATVDEGSSVVINLAGNDSDPDNALDLSSITITSGPANGTLVDHGDGTLTYTHDGSETVGDSFSYTIDDVSGATSNVASVTLTVTPQNDAPTAANDAATVDEGSSVVINLAGNDSDPDNALDLSSITITSGPANGTLVDHGDGTFTYTHDGSETVGDSFSYTIDDVSGATSNVASVTLTVTPQNDAPTAANDAATVDEGSSVVINLAGNDSDPDNALDLSSITITSGPANGTLVDNGDGTLTYTHDGSETVGDSFTYTIDDVSGATSNVASVTLTVTPQNDAPTAANDAATVDEGSSVVINLAGNDSDPDNALDLSSITITSGPANGTLVDHGDGTFTYTHDGSETVGDSFSYTIDDVSGATSNVASVTLTVTPQNDAPTAANDAATVDEGSSVVINLAGNDSDPDNALDLSSITITSGPANGTLVDNGDGTLTYTHDGSETVGDSFTYTIDDVSGATSNVASVTLTVTPQNDAPTAANDAATVDEGSSVVINLAGNDSDPDNALDLSSITITSGPANGTLVDHGDGTFTYTHDGSETVGDSFSYTIDDVSGATSNVASVTLTVTPQNDAPTAANDAATVDEGSSVVINLAGNDSDPDNALDLSSITITSGPANGTLVDHGDGTLTYTHDGSETVGDSFSYTIDDVSGATSNVASVTLTVTPQNDAPTAANDAATVDEGSSVVINLAGNDSDPDNALDLSSITITSGPANGTLVDHGDGTFTYTHDGSETVGDSFSYTIDDVSGATSNVASVTLTVTPQNDAPTAANDAATVDEGSSVVINLAGNDSDPDNALDLSSITITSGPANGTLVDNGDGTLTYTHDGSETVGDSFTYTIDDVSGATSNVASVTLTVTPQNDAPTAANDAATVDEGSSVVINLAGNDSDPDNALDLSSITITSGPANGTLVDHGDGTFTYTHDGSETVGDSFSYTIDDVSGATSNVASVTLTVTPQNDAPTAANDAATVDEGSSVVINLAGNDSDPDNALDLSSITITSGPANGTLVDHGDGTLTYTHDGSETVGDSFSYTIDDVSGATSNVASVTLTVTPQNDSPILGNNALTISEGGAVILSSTDLSATDAETGAGLLQFTVSGVTGGRFELVGSPGVPITSFTQAQVAAGQVQFVHDGGEAAPAYSVTVSDSALIDGPLAATITFTNVNDVPTIIDQPMSVDENTPAGALVGAVAAGDADAGDALVFSITGGNTGGAFAIDPANGDLFVADPAPIDFEVNPTIALTVTVEDLAGATDSATVTVSVLNLNEPLSITGPGGLSLAPGASLVFSTTGGTSIAISDPDGPTAPLELTLSATGGTMTLPTTAGLAMLAGTGAGDATMTFRGTVAAVQTALEGLAFDSDGSASAGVALAATDLGPGGTAASANFGIAVQTVTTPTPTTPPPVDPPVDPPISLPPTEITDPADPEAPTTRSGPESSAPEPASPAPEPVATPTSLGPAPGFSVPNRYQIEHVEFRQIEANDAEAALVEGTPLTPREDLSPREHRAGEVPFDLGLLRASFVHPDFLASLDRMRQDVLESDRETSGERDWFVPAIESIAMVATTGLLAGVLRASSLLAAAISAVPLWKQADPLMILSLSKDERRDLEASLRHEQGRERALDAVLDRRPRADEAGEAEDEETPEE